MTQPTHLNRGATKRQCRRAADAAQRDFCARMQERTDLYALTFRSSFERREAVRRLKRRLGVNVCWTLDVVDRADSREVSEQDKRLILGRGQLPLLKGIRNRKRRLITRKHLHARLKWILDRNPHIGSHGIKSIVAEHVCQHLLRVKYFTLTLSRRMQVTFLHALNDLRQQQPQLLFST